VPISRSCLVRKQFRHLVVRHDDRAPSNEGWSYLLAFRNGSKVVPEIDF